jgi:ketosteroid isomerase-like protein
MAESENVKRLLALRDAHERGDFDAVIESVHPEFELVRIQGGPESKGEPLRGRDAFRSWMEPDVFESFWIEITGIHERDDVVLFDAIAHGVFGDSGMEIEQPTYLVWYFRDGLPVRLESYTERAAGLSAAGIEEA